MIEEYEKLELGEPDKLEPKRKVRYYANLTEDGSLRINCIFFYNFDLGCYLKQFELSEIPKNNNYIYIEREE